MHFFGDAHWNTKKSIPFHTRIWREIPGRNEFIHCGINTTVLCALVSPDGLIHHGVLLMALLKRSTFLSSMVLPLWKPNCWVILDVPPMNRQDAVRNNQIILTIYQSTIFAFLPGPSKWNCIVTCSVIHETFVLRCSNLSFAMRTMSR